MTRNHGGGVIRRGIIRKESLRREASGRHLGGDWEASTVGFPPKPQQTSPKTEHWKIWSCCSWSTRHVLKDGEILSMKLHKCVFCDMEYVIIVEGVFYWGLPLILEGPGHKEKHISRNTLTFISILTLRMNITLAFPRTFPCVFSYICFHSWVIDFMVHTFIH